MYKEIIGETSEGVIFSVNITGCHKNIFLIKIQINLILLPKHMGKCWSREDRGTEESRAEKLTGVVPSREAWAVLSGMSCRSLFSTSLALLTLMLKFFIKSVLLKCFNKKLPFIFCLNILIEKCINQRRK